MKNLFRYRKRTIITSAALAAGVMIYILMDSMIAGSMDMSEDNILKYEYGHGSITTTQTWEDRDYLPLDSPIPDGVSLADELNGQDGISAAPRTQFMGDMILYKDPFPEDGNMQVVLTGIDPERDRRVFDLPGSLSKGRWLESGKDQVVIGSWMASEIGADIGYYVTVVCRTRDGYYQTMDLEIAGILDTPNPTVNRLSMFIPLDTADYALDMAGGVTEIVVKLPGDREVDSREKKQVQELLPPDLVYHSWKEQALVYIAASNGDRYSTVVILFLIFIIAAVGVSNTMLMSAMERTREMGMMRAMGMRDRDLKRMFLMEAAGIGFLGSLLGIVLGSLGNIPLVLKGIPLPASTDQYDMGYRISGAMWGVWKPETMIFSLLLGMAITILVSRLSVRKILKFSIVEDLRHY